MNRPELPSRLDDEALARLPVDLGLADLERELLRERSAGRSRPARRLPVIAAAAATVAVVASVGVTLAALSGDEDPASEQNGVAGSPSGPSTLAESPFSEPATGTPGSEPRITTGAWAGQQDFLVLDAAGWSANGYAVTDPGYGLSYGWKNGQRTFEVSYVAARHWEDLKADNLQPREGATIGEIEVLGDRVPYVETESQQQMAFVTLPDGSGIRIDGGFTTPADFAALVSSLSSADAAGFEAAQPGIVPPARLDDALARIVGEIPAVPDRDLAVDVAGYNSPASLDGAVLMAVSCLWVDEYADALDAGSDEGIDAAVAGLRGVSRSPVGERAGYPADLNNGAVVAMRDHESVESVSGRAGCSG